MIIMVVVVAVPPVVVVVVVVTAPPHPPDHVGRSAAWTVTLTCASSHIGLQQVGRACWKTCGQTLWCSMTPDWVWSGS